MPAKTSLRAHIRKSSVSKIPTGERMHRTYLAICAVLTCIVQCGAEELLQHVDITCPRGEMVLIPSTPPSNVDRRPPDGITKITIAHNFHDVTEFTVSKVVRDMSLVFPKPSITSIKDLRDAPVGRNFHNNAGILTINDDNIVADPAYGNGDFYTIRGVSARNPTVVVLSRGTGIASMWWAKCESLTYRR